MIFKRKTIIDGPTGVAGFGGGKPSDDLYDLAAIQ